jgi:hypothetical protein
MSEGPRIDDVDRMERALGWRPIRFRPAAQNRGTSDTAARWIVANGERSAFVKIGATDLTAGWTRAEHRNYAALDGWFLPRVLGFDDDGMRPVLALEDLSRASWPPPWTKPRITGVLEALAAIRRTDPPAHLLGGVVDLGPTWRLLAEDPAPFLALRLCSVAWLDRNLPALMAASDAAPLHGNALLHLDVRSDNLCFRAGRAIIIDWNHATVGNPDIDIAGWLPSLQAEGGPPPEEILPHAPELAAWLAGYFCSHAGQEPIADAPHVRPLQLAQARAALPWAIRALGLEDPRRERR